MNGDEATGGNIVLSKTEPIALPLLRCKGHLIPIKEMMVMSNSLISEDLIITGNIKSASGIEIQGRVTGDIDAISVEIGTSGSVEGNVSSKSADIRGSMKGALSTVSVIIHSKADVKANITAEEMASENGARIAGKINITGPKGS